MDLSGKYVFVTGSARGIGKAIASAFVKKGCHVIIHATGETSRLPDAPNIVETAKELSMLGHEVKWVVGDLTKEEVVVEIFQKLPRVDVLIACAGGNFGKTFDVVTGGKPKNDDVLSISLEDFKANMEVNLDTVFLTCKHGMRKLKEAYKETGFARIVLIGSVAGTMGRSFGASYAVAKAAVHEYGRCLAAAITDNNFTVNVVAPGPTYTERFARNLGMDQAKFTEEMKYGCHVDEIAEGVLEVCMVKGLHGQVVRIDRGMQLFSA